MKEKVLVLGGSGLLGQLVVKQLVNDGYHVKIVTRDKNKCQHLISDQVEVIEADVTNKYDMQQAIVDCDFVHISLSYPVESVAVKLIVELASKSKIKKLSYVSGATVKAEHQFFQPIKDKYLAEQMIINSTINYQIFKPSFFMEAIPKLVNNGRATVLGKQKAPYHFLAGHDFAKLVSKQFQTSQSYCKQTFGPEAITVNEVLTRYCQKKYPEIKAVSNLPYGMAKFIAWLSKNSQLKFASDLFAYLERVGECYDPDSEILTTRYDSWLSISKD